MDGRRAKRARSAVGAPPATPATQELRGSTNPAWNEFKKLAGGEDGEDGPAVVSENSTPFFVCWSALHRLHHSRLLLCLAVVACFTHADLLFSRTAQDDEDLFSDIVAQTPVRREPVRESAADRVELNRAQAMVVTLQAQVCDPVRRSNATSLLPPLSLVPVEQASVHPPDQLSCAWHRAHGIPFGCVVLCGCACVG
jgi:hypothetical protein